MITRRRVLEMLRAAGPAGASGEHVADEIGVSRAAIARHVATLREAGYEIGARSGVGYVLESVPDLPLADEVAPRVTDRFWNDITGERTTASTNADARELAREGAPQGTVVIAAEQTGGAGRLGRAWSSPLGGVYLSAVLRPRVAPPQVTPLPLVIALGVAQGLAALGAPARVKWPNDVYLGAGAKAGKVAGILLEMSAQADRVEWIVAGVGINVDARAGRFEGAAYLADVLVDHHTATAAAAALDGIAHYYERWCADGFAAIAEEFEDLHMLAGRSVEVRDVVGTVVAAGEVAGVDETGRLLVERGGRVTAVAAGDVTLAKTR